MWSYGALLEEVLEQNRSYYQRNMDKWKKQKAEEGKSAEGEATTAVMENKVVISSDLV